MRQLAGIVLILCVFCTAALAAGPQIIANASVEQDALDSKILRYIFLGKMTTWNTGGLIVPAVLESGPVHEDFLRIYIHKTHTQFSTHWKRMAFTGNAMAIKIFKTEAELMDFVKGQEGAIGYVGESAILENVKRLTVE